MARTAEDNRGMADASERLSALVEAGMALASQLELEPLLQRIADIARGVVGARYAAVGVLDGKGNLSQFIYSGIDDATARMIGDLPIGRGVLGVLVSEAKPVRVPEISEHPKSFGFPKHHPPMHSFLGVPIVVKAAVFGRLYLTEKTDGKEFTKDDERLALTLASQAGIAIENARLHEEITEHRSEMAVLEERERISKELHDGVIQSIYSVGLSLQGTHTLLEREPDTAHERLDGAIAELDNVVRDVRGYIFELQPKLVEEVGMTAAISELARDLEVNTLAQVELVIDPDACGSLEHDQQNHLIQIVREIFSNIARHAQAKRVRLSCKEGDAGVWLTIEDDGIGFDPDAAKVGQGLRNIRSRTETLGAKMSISKPSDKGTIHSIFVPGGGGR